MRGLSDAALDWVLKGARDAGLSFDVDEGSPLFSLAPNHRAQLHNSKDKMDWDKKDRVVGAGLSDRNFIDLSLSDLHPTVMQRRQAIAAHLPEQVRYCPQSLKHLWLEMDAFDVTENIVVEDKFVETKSMWD